MSGFLFAGMIGFTAGVIFAVIIAVIFNLSQQGRIERKAKQQHEIINDIGTLCASIENIFSSYKVGSYSRDALKSEVLRTIGEINKQLNANIDLLDVYYIKNIERFIEDVKRNLADEDGAYHPEAKRNERMYKPADGMPSQDNSFPQNDGYNFDKKNFENPNVSHYEVEKQTAFEKGITTQLPVDSVKRFDKSDDTFTVPQKKADDARDFSFEEEFPSPEDVALSDDFFEDAENNGAAGSASGAELDIGDLPESDIVSDTDEHFELSHDNRTEEQSLDEEPEFELEYLHKDDSSETMTSPESMSEVTEELKQPGNTNSPFYSPFDVAATQEYSVKDLMKMAREPEENASDNELSKKQPQEEASSDLFHEKQTQEMQPYAFETAKTEVTSAESLKEQETEIKPPKDDNTRDSKNTQPEMSKKKPSSSSKKQKKSSKKDDDELITGNDVIEQLDSFFGIDNEN